jgi:hypothetical protein
MVLRLDALQAMRIQESNRLEVAREALKAGIARHIEWLNQEIEVLRKTIRKHLDDDPRLKAMLLASSFTDVAHFAAFIAELARAQAREPLPRPH